MGDLHEGVSVLMWLTGASISQKRVSHLLGLKLQMVVNQHMGAEN